MLAPLITPKKSQFAHRQKKYKDEIQYPINNNFMHVQKTVQKVEKTLSDQNLPRRASHFCQERLEANVVQEHVLHVAAQEY